MAGSSAVGGEIALAKLSETLAAERSERAQEAELAREKIAHLERTVTELTRQSTNEAFQSARKCVRGAV